MPKNNSVIYILTFSIFVTVILSTLVTGFLVGKSLVISSIISNNGPANGEEIMKPANTERLVEIDV